MFSVNFNVFGRDTETGEIWQNERRKLVLRGKVLRRQGYGGQFEHHKSKNRLRFSAKSASFLSICPSLLLKIMELFPG